MCTLHSVATKIQYRAGEEKGRLLVWETAMIARCSMGAHFLRSASPIWQMSADRPSERASELECGRGREGGNFAIVVCCRFFTLTD